MIYESTINNLIVLVRSIGALSIDQIEYFFRDAADKDNIPYYINQLAKSRVFDVDEQEGIVMSHGQTHMKDYEKKKRIHAFWVVAEFGSENVREIIPLAYPSQILFITTDNEVYDLTVCLVASDAQLAYRDRKTSVPDGVIDLVNHIAIVASRQEGEALSAYEFDSFCVLDVNKKPQYYTWG